MSKTISAAAEGMSKFASLTEAIAAYKAGMAAYDRSGIPDAVHVSDEDEEAVVAATFGPSYEALVAWEAPAASFDEAIIALRMAQEETNARRGDIGLGHNLVKLALGYFERTAEEPSLYRLISTYWDRYDALAKAMEVTDNATPATKAKVQEAQFAAGDRLDEATIAICSFVPTWRVDAQIKSDFIDSLYNRNGTLEDDELRALLISLPRVYDASADRRVA